MTCLACAPVVRLDEYRRPRRRRRADRAAAIAIRMVEGDVRRPRPTSPPVSTSAAPGGSR